MNNPLWLLAALPIFWCAIIFVLSLVSGWPALARQYSFKDHFVGKTFSFCSGAVRSIRYSNALTIGVNGEGLYLAMLWPFSFGYQPIFIPWADITAEPYRLVIFSMVRLRFSREPSVPFSIRRTLALKLADASGGAFTV